MPAIVSHWLLGRRTLPEVKALCTETELNETCYLWGCQGPDILFFHRLLPQMRGENVQKYGYDAHTLDPAKLLKGMAALVGRARDPEIRRGLFSYLLGIGCHYSFDRCAHPYVYWLENKMVASDPRGKDFHYHAEIESMLDIILLRSETGMLPCELDMVECIPDAEGIQRVAGVFWTRAVSLLFGGNVTARQADELTGDMRACARLLQDRTALKKPLLYRLERLVGKKDGSVTAFMRSLTEGTDYDFANVCHSEWNNPFFPDRSSSEDFFTIADHAQVETLEIVGILLGAMAGREGADEEISAFTKGLNFNGASASV